jgi:hypothetical protein
MAEIFLSNRPIAVVNGCSKATSQRALTRSAITLLDRVGGRVSDRPVLALARAFLRSGILSEDGTRRSTRTSTPQGGTLSPFMADIALLVLDEHFTKKREALGPSCTRLCGWRPRIEGPGGGTVTPDRSETVLFSGSANSSCSGIACSASLVRLTTTPASARREAASSSDSSLPRQKAIDVARARRHAP